MRWRGAVLTATCLLVVACDVTLHFDEDASTDTMGMPDADATVPDALADAPSTCGPGKGTAGCDASPVCAADVCTCPAPTTFCSGTCANLTSDHNHCGLCLNACANTEHCDNGHCVAGSAKDGGP